MKRVYLFILLLVFPVLSQWQSYNNWLNSITPRAKWNVNYGVSLNSGNVSSWNSTNGLYQFIQATTTYMPYYDGSNKCISLDGIDDYLVINNNTDFDPDSSNFAIAIWAKIASGINTNSERLIYKKNSGAYWILYLNTSGNMRGEVYDGNSVLTCVNSTDIRDDLWHFYVFYRKGNNFYFYIDGNLIQEKSGSIGSLSGTAIGPLYIGYDGGTRFLKADMGNIRYYNRALNKREINRLYNKGRIY